MPLKRAEERFAFRRGHLSIEECICNARTNAPEAQCLFSPRFSVGKRDSTRFVTESRRDGARTLSIGMSGL
jgi:hypothetical protein